jgi:1,4-alpha-glucan branching enzyme
MFSFLKSLLCGGGANSCCGSKKTCSADLNNTGTCQDWAGTAIEFEYFNPAAKEIFLCGDFNNWSSTTNKMKRDNTGRFKLSINLSPGRYQYKFLVDGRWMVDQKPTMLIDNGLGTKNSVLDI